MKKFTEWQENIIFWWMSKFNLGILGISWISWIKGFIMGALLLLLCGCGVQLKTGYVDPIYGNCCDKDIILEVPDTVEVDTLSFSQLKWKLRTDFNFRWNFAQYAMQQPYSWYWNNPRLDGIWRPYNRFDVYFNSSWFWTDWAWNYPFNYNTWGWYNWNRPYYYYGWNQPYRPWNSWYNGPWHSQNYNVVWNASRRGNNIAYINGPRSSRSIEATIYNNRVNNTRPSNNTVIENIISIYRNNGNKVRVYNNNLNNDRIIELNNGNNWETESNSNGWRGRSRQVFPSQSTQPNNFNSVQPRQIRGGSGSPVFQQTRTSGNSSQQGRSSSIRGKN